MLVLNLIANTSLKSRSTKEMKRRDAQLSASVAAAILNLLFDKKHVYYKQFEAIVSETNITYSRAKAAKD